MTESSAFHDFSDYLRIPRVTDLALSYDGSALVATVAALNDDANRFVEALWAIDPSGQAEARRLTWSDKGESGPAFTADGSLLFRSTRGTDAEDSPPALYCLPPTGGEARRLLSCAGGVGSVATARSSDAVVLGSPRLPGSPDDETDERRRTARKDAKVAAILHESSPIRFWDHDLGPAELHLLAIRADTDGTATTRDLTPTPRRALDEQGFVLTPDGATVITGWAVDDEPGFPRPQLVAIDVATGDRHTLADEPYVFYSAPSVSWDGRSLVCVRTEDSSYDEPPRTALWLIDLGTGAGRPLAPELDLWPGEPVFSADGSSVFFTADERGHRPVFRVEVRSGAVSRVTASGHYTHVRVAPDGETLYALRDHVDAPPGPVRLSARGTDVDPEPLPAPGRVGVRGSVVPVEATAEDGTPVHSWLALPSGASAASPVPLLLWIHGGPLNSWNSWSWRWNPWLMVAKGYGVLLPDPALSTGYGESMVRRGWGQWGGTPYTDLMAATDAALRRDDVDESRIAAMGGSYGGYMANWVAGHTDRFRCIVTHASLWALDQFQSTTDHPAYWVREWGLPADQPERYALWSPHHFADRIRTPMLVIHGDKDYRVPIGEGLRLWWDLQRRQVDSKYLYYPDEGHWILKPGNARVWYETVWAWLGQHVLGEKWVPADLL